VSDDLLLGLELRDDAVSAVVAGQDGRVAARTLKRGADAATATGAIGALGRDVPTRAGVAVGDPTHPMAAAVAAATAGAAALTRPPRVLTRGTAMALGEQWCGVARGAEQVVALTIGDCVHAGVVIDGRPFEGAHGRAGAAGWMALNPVEREDYRKLGCLQSEIGGSGIVHRLVWRLKSGDRSRVLEMAGGDMAAITVSDILRAAREGDGLSGSVIRDTARYIGMAIGNIVAVVDPEMVVLGGLIAEAADLLLEPSRTEAARRMPSQAAQAVRIEIASLGEYGGALGAARAAMLAP
jgi:predicted NBD/HSP70 family sugar kinase